jgi:hypothetical protein
MAADLDITFPKALYESSPVDATFVGKLLHRLPTEICLDQVVDVREFHLRGHVYDLQSEGGWIVAENVIAGNCRCGVRLLSVEDAAGMGIAEAKEWQKTGEPPASPAFVAWPNVKQPPGWSPDYNAAA